jgi:hypothetical protein
MPKIDEIVPVYKKNDKCDKCGFRKSFICSRVIKYNAWDGLFDVYNLVIDVFDKTNVDLMHSEELKSHRLGKYHVFTMANIPCAEMVDCKCDSFRCDFPDKIKARKIPFCIYLFNLDIPEKYLNNRNIMYLVRDK